MCGIYGGVRRTLTRSVAYPSRRNRSASSVFFHMKPGPPWPMAVRRWDTSGVTTRPGALMVADAAGRANVRNTAIKRQPQEMPSLMITFMCGRTSARVECSVAALACTKEAHRRQRQARGGGDMGRGRGRRDGVFVVVFLWPAKQTRDKNAQTIITGKSSKKLYELNFSFSSRRPHSEVYNGRERPSPVVSAQEREIAGCSVHAGTKVRPAQNNSQQHARVGRGTEPPAVCLCSNARKATRKKNIKGQGEVRKCDEVSN